MSLELKAGSFYFLWVFGLGFVLGTIRTLFLAPIAGDLIAVLIELPVILTFAWILCARLIKRFEVSNDLASRASMGAIAFNHRIFRAFSHSPWSRWACGSNHLRRFSSSSTQAKPLT